MNASPCSPPSPHGRVDHSVISYAPGKIPGTCSVCNSFTFCRNLSNSSGLQHDQPSFCLGNLSSCLFFFERHLLSDSVLAPVNTRLAPDWILRLSLLGSRTLPTDCSPRLCQPLSMTPVIPGAVCGACPTESLVLPWASCVGNPPLQHFFPTKHR